MRKQIHCVTVRVSIYIMFYCKLPVGGFFSFNLLTIAEEDLLKKSKPVSHEKNIVTIRGEHTVFTPQPLRAVRVLFSPMMSGWAGVRAAGKSLSGLYLRNRKV